MDKKPRDNEVVSSPRGALGCPGPAAWVMCLDPDGRILDLTPELVELLGLGSVEAARGVNALELAPFVGAGMSQEFKRSMETAQPTVLEGECLSATGKLLRLRCQLRPVKGPDGGPLVLVVILEDEGYPGEERDVRKAQSMEVLSRLSAAIAHNFNNFLTVILGYAQLLLDGAPKDHPWRDSLLEISRTADRALAVTGKLLAFGSSQQFKPIVVNVNDLVAEMRETLTLLTGEDVDLVVSLDPNLYPVKADRGQMEQVLLNLVVNAREAMPMGGRVFIETRNVYLDESHGRLHGVEVPAGPYVMIAVTDTGLGMDEEIKSRLFEPFFTTKGRGNGFGLSVVYGMVKQNNGHIWVYSEPRKGSTFKIYLPACEEPEEVPAEEMSIQPRRGQGTVLLVEDDPKVRKLATAMLQRLGYRVISAGSGPEGVNLARANPGLDLLLTDVVMPGMSGMELWEKIATHQPRMRVLFMSGYSGEILHRYGSPRWSPPFLTKPFSAAELRSKVEEALATEPPTPSLQSSDMVEILAPVPDGQVLEDPLRARKWEQRPRILIVDDEASVRVLLSRLLESNGYECVLASNVGEARARLSCEPFHLLLCDVRMPGESGLDLIKEVMPIYPELAVVLVSALDDPEVARVALEQGAYGYILKPFKTNEILIQVANALRRRELEIARRVHVRELERRVDERTQELQIALRDLRQSMEGIVRAMSLAVESRDPYTAGHQRRVAELSRAIARELGMGPERIEGLYMAGLIHDLGKIAVPAEILSKPAKLNRIEFDLIKCHPEVGYEILKPLQFPWPIADMVRQHHEKMDGSGYPLGLTGEEILPESRILVVADVVEAIVSHRPYRPALGIERALEEVEKNRGILYDAEVVETCSGLFREKGFQMENSGHGG